MSNENAKTNNKNVVTTSCTSYAWPNKAFNSLLSFYIST